MGVVHRSFVLAVAMVFLAGGCAGQAVPRTAVLPADPNFRPDVPMVYYVAESGTVYISLSAKDHIQPGQRFICQGTRDRATVEVLEVGRDYSVCRLVDTHAAVKTGDTVLVDHRARNYAIAGNFDLQNRGYSTVEDRARVERIIAQRGGKIIDEVSFKADYLVAGARPADPVLPGDAPQGSVIAERREEQKHYDQFVQDAYDHVVPVLNTNRLMAQPAAPLQPPEMLR